MFFNRKKSNAKKPVEDKIISLQAQREEAKTRIRKIRAEMELLVHQATDADDLDRKVMSMDYEARKNTLAVETEHFADLSRLITQLQNIQLEQNRQNAFSDVETASNSIDAEALIEAGDKLNVRRAMLQEEDERLESMFCTPTTDTQQFKENEEFAMLVKQAKMEKANTSEKPTSDMLPSKERGIFEAV